MNYKRVTPPTKTVPENDKGVSWLKSAFFNEDIEESKGTCTSGNLKNDNFPSFPNQKTGRLGSIQRKKWYTQKLLSASEKQMLLIEPLQQSIIKVDWSISFSSLFII